MIEESNNNNENKLQGLFEALGGLSVIEAAEERAELIDIDFASLVSEYEEAIKQHGEAFAVNDNPFGPPSDDNEDTLSLNANSIINDTSRLTDFVNGFEKPSKQFLDAVYKKIELVEGDAFNYLGINWDRLIANLKPNKKARQLFGANAEKAISEIQFGHQIGYFLSVSNESTSNLIKCMALYLGSDEPISQKHISRIIGVNQSTISRYITTYPELLRENLHRLTARDQAIEKMTQENQNSPNGFEVFSLQEVLDSIPNGKESTLGRYSLVNGINSLIKSQDTVYAPWFTFDDIYEFFSEDTTSKEMQNSKIADLALNRWIINESQNETDSLLRNVEIVVGFLDSNKLPEIPKNYSENYLLHLDYKVKYCLLNEIMEYHKTSDLNSSEEPDRLKVRILSSENRWQYLVTHVYDSLAEVITAKTDGNIGVSNDEGE